MPEAFTELTEDEFDDRYPLVQNHINPTAGWSFGEETGCLFETYGDELEFVKRQDTRKVWTLVDGDDGELYIVSGFHLVNRIGYLLSTIPVLNHATVQVHVAMTMDDEPNPVPSE